MFSCVFMSVKLIWPPIVCAKTLTCNSAIRVHSNVRSKSTNSPCLGECIHTILTDTK